MRRTILPAAVAAACLAFAGQASAGFNRTFVSGTGNDSGNTTCGRSGASTVGPCRSFAVALANTNLGGEIVVLDSAGYGPFTIDRSVTVSANNVEAAITATTGVDGIDIATAGVTVTLNGLIISGGGGQGQNGISFTAGAALNIQNCVIRGFKNYGLNLTAASPVTVSDTILSNNFRNGVVFAPTGAASATFTRVQILSTGVSPNPVNGLLVQSQGASGGAVTASMDDSVVANTYGVGVAPMGTTAVVTLSNSQVFSNTTGIYARNNATINLAQVTIFGNTTFGYEAGSGGKINSFRTTVSGVNYNGNYIVDTNNSGTLTAAAPQ